MMDRARGAELKEHGPRLPVSQLGHCPRRCIFEAVRHHPEHSLHVEVTHPYDEYVQEIMEVGNVWERETSVALQRAYGNFLPRDTRPAAFKHTAAAMHAVRELMGQNPGSGTNLH